MAHSYLPYEEPGITTILSLTSLLLLLNIIRYILDRLLYSGIIGEILIGIIWGLPVGGTSWLPLGTQETIQAFGYLGLIGLVFEGGLCTDPAQLRNSLFLSISVATIGLCLPIALSFALLGFPFPMAGSAEVSFPTALAAFSAGASLCSTSLGTTFAILSSAGMQKSRTGTVLVGAAMMDDVVGLVMVNIVTTLGAGNTKAWPIARPIVASFGLLIVTLLLVSYLLQPMWKGVRRVYIEGSQGRSPARPKAQLKDVILRRLYNIPHLEFLLSTFVLVAFVMIAYFIDASVLFAAFIAGGVVTNLRDLEHRQTDTESPEGLMYDIYYKPVMDFVLVPFFFASIGFSIPITAMFTGSVVWKGIVYTLLMIFGKIATGMVFYVDYFQRRWRSPPVAHTTDPSGKSCPATTQQVSEKEQRKPPHAQALLVAFAMVARGEIGFLIASLSQSSGTLSLRQQNGAAQEQGNEDVFLVIVWAVTLCTIIGPVSVGILVRNLKRSGIDLSNF